MCEAAQDTLTVKEVQEILKIGTNSWVRLWGRAAQHSLYRDFFVQRLLPPGLMNTAQACSNRRYTWHHSPEESQAAVDAGYPYGFGDNLTVFTGTADAAQHAIDNWINSPGHFQTMIDPRCDCIGVGVTQYDGITYCYMFVGIPNSVNFYA